MTGRDLVSLFEGTYSGDPIYGLSVGGPVATNVTIANGHVTAASKVYLP